MMKDEDIYMNKEIKIAVLMAEFISLILVILGIYIIDRTQYSGMRLYFINLYCIIYLFLLGGLFVSHLYEWLLRAIHQQKNILHRNIEQTKENRNKGI